jgi:hypothetical protein
MTVQSLLGAGQYARYQVFMGEHPEDIAGELEGPMFRLDEREARFVSYLAFKDRGEWEAAQQSEIDARARAAEFDLSVSTPAVRILFGPVSGEVRGEALQVARRARASLRVRREDMTGLIYGAFLMDYDAAAEIVAEAFADGPERARSRGRGGRPGRRTGS